MIAFSRLEVEVEVLFSELWRNVVFLLGKKDIDGGLQRGAGIG